MVQFTVLNDTKVDGVASSSFQGEFLGVVRSMPAASAELEGRLVLYVGYTGAYQQYAFYVCQMNMDGTWQWNLQNLRPPYTLTPLRVAESDADGNLVSSQISVTELNTLSGVRSSVQNQLDGKEPTVLGAAMTVTRSKLTPQRTLISDANGNISISTVTSSELASLKGLKSPIQDQLDDKVDSLTEINGHPLTGDVELTAEDVGAMPSGTAIPSKLSEMTNDVGFVTADTQSLENYYLKDDTYTKTEVNNLYSTVSIPQYRAVDTLPSTGEAGYIYIIPKDGQYEQYVWSDFVWVYLGLTTAEPDIAQDSTGISINGIDLQSATSEQTGLMTSTYVDWLYRGSVTGGTGSVSNGTLTIRLNTHDDDIELEPITLPSAQNIYRLVRDRSENLLETLVTFHAGSDTAEPYWEISEAFDVEVWSKGRFGETNFMMSTIHIQDGTYASYAGDIVFANAESNTRVGVRVLFKGDGSYVVYDCNGLTVDAFTDKTDLPINSSVYRTARTVIRAE